MSDLIEEMKVKKIYLVLESNHGDFNCDGVGIEVKGAFAKKEKAIECANSNLENWRADTDFALEADFTEFQLKDLDDTKPPEISCEVYKGYQNNWNAYFELMIMRLDVE